MPSFREVVFRSSPLKRWRVVFEDDVPILVEGISIEWRRGRKMNEKVRTIIEKAAEQTS